MVVVSILEIAIGALIVPIFDQVFANTEQQSPTLFGLQRLIPESGLAAWRTIAILLIVFTLVKGIAEYFSTYLMARIGQSSILRYGRIFTRICSRNQPHSLSVIARIILSRV